MESSLVTIGLTCFNAEKTIERAVRSALGQDWPNIEVLIVDDNSNDDSIEVIKSVINSDHRTRLIQHEHNRGAAGARNTILSEAKGEFVVFFDDDDHSLSARVSEQIKVLTDYEACIGKMLVACYAGGVRQYSNGFIKKMPAIGSCGRQKPIGSGLADYLLFYHKRAEWFYGAGVPTCALMARKSTFDAVAGFDTGLRRAEDVDFAVRLALEGGHFIGTKKSLFVQYATETDDKSYENNMLSEQLLVKKYKEYLFSKGRYYYALHWPKLRYCHFRHQYGRFLREFIGLFIRNPVSVIMHLFQTGPRRLWHERRIKKQVPR